MGNNILRIKTYSFALKILKLHKYLLVNRKEYILSKQILRCGTSIGALIRESEYAQSKADFISKLSIALKEANETDYWLSLFKDSDYIDQNTYNLLKTDCDEILKLLTTSIKTAKSNLIKK